MTSHPRLVYIGDTFGRFSVSTFMGAFGAPTLKPTKLLSNRPWVAELTRKADKDLRAACKGDTVSKTLNAKAQPQVTGNKEALKETQIYPWEYARSVFKAHSQNTAIIEEVESIDSSDTDSHWSMPDDDWSDLDPDQIGEVVGLERGQMPLGANIFLR